MLNLQGMLKAPTVSDPSPVFIATYSDGFALTRKEITAPTRFAAYCKARVYGPAGHALTHLRQKKGGQ